MKKGTYESSESFESQEVWLSSTIAIRGSKAQTKARDEALYASEWYRLDSLRLVNSCLSMRLDSKQGTHCRIIQRTQIDMAFGKALDYSILVEMATTTW